MLRLVYHFRRAVHRLAARERRTSARELIGRRVMIPDVVGQPPKTPINNSWVEVPNVGVLVSTRKSAALSSSETTEDGARRHRFATFDDSDHRWTSSGTSSIGAMGETGKRGMMMSAPLNLSLLGVEMLC
jgi:hypothetical protein